MMEINVMTGPWMQGQLQRVRILINGPRRLFENPSTQAIAEDVICIACDMLEVHR
jgi:hypothetical protein